MKASRFSEEQIIAVLREHKAAAKTAEVRRWHGIFEDGNCTGATLGQLLRHGGC
jgi:hypothetical protein